VAKIKYKLVDHDGDELHPTTIHYDTRYSVKLKSVEIIQAPRGEDEETLVLTLEYLHGLQPNIGQPKLNYCTNCGHKLPE